MGNVFEQLGINTDVIEAVKPEEVYEGGNVIEPGLYDAVVDKAFIRKTDSGASMFHLDLNVLVDGEPTTLSYTTAIKSGDEKGNKATYTTNNGKEVPLPGVVSMVKFLRTIGKEDATTQEATIKFKDNNITVLAFEGLSGKKLKIGVTHEENEWEGNVFLKNNIKYFLKEDGTNDAGENIEEKVIESIKKNPVKKLKKKAQEQTQNQGTSSSAEVPASW